MNQWTREFDWRPDWLWGRRGLGCSIGSDSIDGLLMEVGVRHFDHEGLHVYQIALEFVEWVNEVLPGARRLHPHLRDQLLRASTSIVLNIAEGAGEFSRREKARFYRIARRSATESAAMLDILQAMKALPEADLEWPRAHLSEIVAMLIGLARTFE